MFTARSPGVARWAGAASGVYCLLYAVAGAVIGMAAKVLLPALEARDDAFAEFVEMQLPPILAGLVLAAALAAVMSTSSGALIATATVFSQDIVARLRKRDIEAGSEHDHVRSNRIYVACFGILMIVIACLLQDVVAALTVAYDILVGGLLIPILGGLLWRRGTNVGAIAAMAVGTVATLATMIRRRRHLRQRTDLRRAGVRPAGVRRRQFAQQADRKRRDGGMGASEPRGEHRARARDGGDNIVRRCKVQACRSLIVGGEAWTDGGFVARQSAARLLHAQWSAGPGFVGIAQSHAILGIGPDSFDIFGDDNKSDLHHPRPDAEVSAQASRTTASRTTAGIAAAEAPTATVGSLPENGNAREFAAAENVGIPESVGRGGGGAAIPGEFLCPDGRPAKRFVRAGDAQHRDPRGSSIGQCGRRSACLRFARTASGARHRRAAGCTAPGRARAGGPACARRTACALTVGSTGERPTGTQ